MYTTYIHDQYIYGTGIPLACIKPCACSMSVMLFQKHCNFYLLYIVNRARVISILIDHDRANQPPAVPEIFLVYKFETRLLIYTY